MTLEENKAALQEIIDKLESEDELTVEEVKQLEEKAAKLEAEKRALVEAAEKRSATLEKVKNGMGKEVESNKEERKETKNMDKEYRSAYLKTLLGRELNKEEREAYTHKTTDTGAPVPTEMLDEIWDLISEQHSILDDITIYRTGTAITITKHTAIVQGGATTVNEDAANNDEKNTFVEVTLSGKDFSKTIKVSYAMSKMSIASFEKYLINEISGQLGEALASDVITQIKTDMASGNIVTGTGNDDKVKYTELTTTYGKLKRTKTRIVYVNEATLYNQLCGLVDKNDRPIYQPNLQADAEGVLLGAKVKIESALSDGEILVGDSKRVVLNVVQDIIVEDDKDIEKHKYIYSGYARAEATLVDSQSFAMWQPKTSGGSI